MIRICKVERDYGRPEEWSEPTARTYSCEVESAVGRETPDRSRSESFSCMVPCCSSALQNKGRSGAKPSGLWDELPGASRFHSPPV